MNMSEVKILCFCQEKKKTDLCVCVAGDIGGRALQNDPETSEIAWCHSPRWARGRLEPVVHKLFSCRTSPERTIIFHYPVHSRAPGPLKITGCSEAKEHGLACNTDGAIIFFNHNTWGGVKVKKRTNLLQICVKGAAWHKCISRDPC